MLRSKSPADEFYHERRQQRTAAERQQVQHTPQSKGRMANIKEEAYKLARPSCVFVAGVAQTTFIVAVGATSWVLMYRYSPMRFLRREYSKLDAMYLKAEKQIGAKIDNLFPPRFRAKFHPNTDWNRVVTSGIEAWVLRKMAMPVYYPTALAVGVFTARHYAKLRWPHEWSDDAGDGDAALGDYSMDDGGYTYDRQADSDGRDDRLYDGYENDGRRDDERFYEEEIEEKLRQRGSRRPQRRRDERDAADAYERGHRRQRSRRDDDFEDEGFDGDRGYEREYFDDEEEYDSRRSQSRSF